MSILIKGLKYIVPCQSQFSRKPIDTIIDNDYNTMSTAVKKCLENNRMSTTDERAKQAFPELERIVRDLYSKPLSSKQRRRIQREHKNIKSLQALLRSRPDIIICRIDKNPGFYIGNVATIAAKAQEYMNITEAYEEMSDSHSLLPNSLSATQNLLEHLVKTKGLTKAQSDKLLPKSDKLELAHLYVLIKIHKPDMPLRPIIAGIHAPTALVSKFLNNLLAPIYSEVARETTFINSTHVAQILHQYIANGYLKSTTKFIIADVKNLYTVIPREGGRDAFIRFLEKYSKNGKIGTLSIDHIWKMARLVLENNYFFYNDKCYKQIRGGAMGSAFTQVYANIYMLEWEQDLIEYQKSHNEIYYRYMDDILMTTNQPLAEIQIEFEKAKNKDINIEIEPIISTSANYLDMTITNENAKFKTTIYHKPTADPYYLPYTSDHPHRYHRNIPYSALVRAARLCSDVHDFNRERLRIEISLLLSNYPPKLITEQFLRFFQVNNAEPVLKRLDEQAYHRLRQKLLYPTKLQKKNTNQSLQQLIEHPPVLQSKQWDSSVMYVRYTFESGPRLEIANEFFSWWRRHYQYPESLVKNIKIRLIPKTNRTLKDLLIHSKPSKSILPTTSTTDSKNTKQNTVIPFL